MQWFKGNYYRQVTKKTQQLLRFQRRPTLASEDCQSRNLVVQFLVFSYFSESINKHICEGLIVNTQCIQKFWESFKLRGSCKLLMSELREVTPVTFFFSPEALEIHGSFTWLGQTQYKLQLKSQEVYSLQLKACFVHTGVYNLGTPRVFAKLADQVTLFETSQQNSMPALIIINNIWPLLKNHTKRQNKWDSFLILLVDILLQFFEIAPQTSNLLLEIV